MRQGTVLVSALAVFSGGCSFVFGEGPPADHARLAYFDCVSTYGLPVADGLFALSGVLGASDAFGKSKQQYAADNNGDSRNTVGGTDVAVAAIYTASAAYGIIQAARCQKAKEELEARIMRPGPAFRPPSFGAVPVAPAAPPLPPPVMVPPPVAPAPPPPGPAPDEPTVTPTLPAPAPGQPAPQAP